MNIKRFFLKHFPLFIITLTVIALFLTNYTPHTFLLGWDSLQTELAPALSIKRAVFSVWEEYQSFGLLAGMAHGADLPRAIFIFLVSFILPQSLIRYFFHFLMILLAGLGMFKLLEFLGFAKEKKTIALLGSMFYILNFAVIQIMFLPFEPFSIFFGLLPWEIWIFANVLKQTETTRKTWLIFLSINLIAVSKAYLQQLFMVYIIVLALFLLGLFLKEKSSYVLKRGFIGIFLIIAINSFWLLPQIYFLASNGSVIKEAKINQLATENVFYSNKDKGNYKDFFAFNSFYYDSLDKNSNPLFKVWKDQRDNNFTLFIIYTLSAISLLGLLRKSHYQFSFILIYILVAIFLLSDAFPFEQINQIIRSNSLLNQVFRSPFTKFGIPYALVSSYFLACGLDLILNRKLLHKVKPVLFILVFGSIIFQAWPAFDGNYISNEMKVKIPKPYFAAMDYFKVADKNKRIALLPEYTFWGWFYNNWPASPDGGPASPDGGQGGGYDGSGFLWYGIEQPIISRTFDVWSSKSEGYFWEMKNALETEDVSLFEKVLEKYNIDYLIFDYSISPIVSGAKALQLGSIDDMLVKSKKISLDKKFDFLSIYKVNHQKKIVDFVWSADNLPNLGPEIKVTNLDTAYQNYGDYQTTKTPDIYYPFLDLTSQTILSDKKWSLGESFSNWYLSRDLNFDIDQYRLSTTSGTVRMNLYINQEPVEFILPFNISIENKTITVSFPKIKIPLFNLTDTNIRNCSSAGDVKFTLAKDSVDISSSGKGIGCFGYKAIYLDQRYGYVVKIKNQNITGQRLFFYIMDETNGQSPLETRLTDDLDYYIIGSRFKQGLGYGFSFQNNSYNNIPSINKISDLSVYLLPYDELKNISFIKDQNQIQNAIFNNSFSAKKINYSLYSASLSKNGYIILNQAFAPGWKAYQVENHNNVILSKAKDLFPFFFGNELKNHVLVNNWSNGWVLPDNYTLNANHYTLAIVFLPQYLQYLGFLLLGLSVILVLKTKH